MGALTLGNGVQVVLGPVLAKAGEGTIHEIVGHAQWVAGDEISPHPRWVAKVFHPTLAGLDAKLDKVVAMVASPPAAAVQSDASVVLTWPLHTLIRDGHVVGYVMSRIDTTNAVEIHTLSNPSNRVNPLASAPQWTKNATWFHLVNVAANLCLAVENAHRVGAVIGDFQERNILVCDTTQVTLVDCDSMQFTDAGGRQFLCGVGRPEFTAPELADTNLRSTPRDIPSDLFALAVHIHLLLMAGNHPFMRGSWTGDTDQPDALTLARAGHWAGGWQSPLHTHPLAPPPSFLPIDVQQLFNRAFTTGAHDPAQRPTAREWRAALLRITTTDCARGAHQIPTGCRDCPWCSIEYERMARKHHRKTATAAPRQGHKSYPANTRQPVAPPRPDIPATPTKVARLNTRSRLIVFGAVAAMIAVAVALLLATSHPTHAGGNPHPTNSEISR